VRKYPAPESGDVFITNHPYLATHQSDVVVCRPMFCDGQHVGFAVNIGHWTDIGGMSAGGCAGTSTHVVQDGLIIPLCKLYDRGVLIEQTCDFILTNVRLPEDDWGDLMSQIASTAIAETRVQELAQRYGLGAVLAGMDAAIAYSGARFLAKMQEIPDGIYEATDFIEDDGVSDRRYAISVKVTKTSAGFVVDFAGTAQQAPTPINAALSSARAGVFTGIIALVDPTIPVNAGIFDHIEVLAPPGTIVNATWPAPVYGCTFEMAKRVPETILMAFAAAISPGASSIHRRAKNPLGTIIMRAAKAPRPEARETTPSISGARPPTTSRSRFGNINIRCWSSATVCGMAPAGLATSGAGWAASTNTGCWQTIICPVSATGIAWRPGASRAGRTGSPIAGRSGGTA
jgi:N-methylhydantoinase B/oxoprolinase/acetone carboxylase alpha subunit